MRLYGLLLLGLLCSSPPAAQAFEGSDEMPVYQARHGDTTVRRREGGLVDETGSTTRGLARGESRGLKRGLARGPARGLKRGGAYPVPDLIAPFAPLSIGLSATDQPVLYWYLSDSWDEPLDFALNPPDSDEPLLFLNLNPPPGGFQAGFHAVNLADHNVRLQANTEYEWLVVLTPDPGARSGDMVASAVLKYQPTDFPAGTSHFEYARAGFWYDAAHGLTQLIQQHPTDAGLKKQRAALSRQVKMPKVAAFDETL